MIIHYPTNMSWQQNCLCTQQKIHTKAFICKDKMTDNWVKFPHANLSSQKSWKFPFVMVGTNLSMFATAKAKVATSFYRVMFVYHKSSRQAICLVEVAILTRRLHFEGKNLNFKFHYKSVYFKFKIGNTLLPSLQTHWWELILWWTDSNRWVIVASCKGADIYLLVFSSVWTQVHSV